MNKILLTLIILASFLLGTLTSIFFATSNFNLDYNKEVASSMLFTNERPSPKDRITIKDLELRNDKVIIHVKNAVIASFTDTNSMDPVIDAEANAIEVPITPEMCDDLQIGDIASYKSNQDGSIIIHRIYYIGEDEKGKYFLFKGDNNEFIDPEKVRCEQLQRLVLGILY